MVTFVTIVLEKRARSASVLSIPELVKAAVFVETAPNTKPDKKPKILYYHRFYIPVQVGNKIYTMRLVAEERKDVFTFNPTAINLYDVVVENKKPSATIPPQEDGTSIANGSNLSIRGMLSNVNDYEGVPYINADGSGNYAQEVLSQKENVRKKYEGTGQWMKAPNGEATKLTEDQWLTVRTEAFKEWFGDWG